MIGYAVIMLIFSLGILFYGFHDLILYILGKKIKAIIVDVETVERYDGGGARAIFYTYRFNDNNVSRVVTGPKNYILFPILSTKRKIGKRVYVSYNAKTNKVSKQLHTIIWWTTAGILGTYSSIMQIKSMIESILNI